MKVDYQNKSRGSQFFEQTSACTRLKKYSYANIDGGVSNGVMITELG